MGANANNQTLRGADVACTLYKNGSIIDVIEAEEITYTPQLKTIESEVLSLGYTTEDTHVDRSQADITGVRKSNGFLNEVLAQIKRNRTTGKAFEKYTAVINFRDINSNQIVTIKLKDANLSALKPFASGAIFAKQTEGLTLSGIEA
jgi:hypothetical protein